MYFLSISIYICISIYFYLSIYLSIYIYTYTFIHIYMYRNLRVVCEPTCQKVLLREKGMIASSASSHDRWSIFGKSRSACT